MDDDGTAGDLGVHHRALADGERVLRGDLAIDLAFDPGWPLEHELARDVAALSEEGTGTAALLGPNLGLVPLEHLHLPGLRTAHGSRLHPAGVGPISPLTILPE